MLVFSLLTECPLNFKDSLNVKDSLCSNCPQHQAIVDLISTFNLRKGRSSRFKANLEMNHLYTCRGPMNIV